MMVDVSLFRQNSSRFLPRHIAFRMLGQSGPLIYHFLAYPKSAGGRYFSAPWRACLDVYQANFCTLSCGFGPKGSLQETTKAPSPHVRSACCTPAQVCGSPKHGIKTHVSGKISPWPGEEKSLIALRDAPAICFCRGDPCQSPVYMPLTEIFGNPAGQVHSPQAKIQAVLHGASLTKLGLQVPEIDTRFTTMLR